MWSLACGACGEAGPWQGAARVLVGYGSSAHALRRQEEAVERVVTEGSRERGQRWKLAREKRDEALVVLDRHAMLVCRTAEKQTMLAVQLLQHRLSHLVVQQRDMIKQELKKVDTELRKLEDETAYKEGWSKRRMQAGALAQWLQAVARARKTRDTALVHLADLEIGSEEDEDPSRRRAGL